MTLRLLQPEEIAARRRPRAVLFLFGWQLAWGLVVATPAHAWARRVWGGHPDGDAALWTPGGADLLAWLGPMDAAEGTVLRVTALLVIAGVVLAQAPLAVLLASLATGRGDLGLSPSLRESRRAAVATLMPMLTTLAAVGLLETILVVIGTSAGSAADSALVQSLGEASATRVGFAVFAPFALVALGLGVFGDLVRTAIARDAASDEPAETAWGSFMRGLRDASAVGLRGWLRGVLAWAWRAAIGLALVFLGALASDGLGGRGGAALALLFAIHQLLVLARTALRASWLARATRLVALADQRASDL